MTETYKPWTVFNRKNLAAPFLAGKEIAGDIIEGAGKINVSPDFRSELEIVGILAGLSAGIEGAIQMHNFFPDLPSGVDALVGIPSFVVGAAAGFSLPVIVGSVLSLVPLGLGTVFTGLAVPTLGVGEIGARMYNRAVNRPRKG